ncbi:hypothetical protein Acr_00g0058820 [Actinidia rufa]|uniref:Uncharacterized protein n=1 Tax=Actinidia rufa TaxID=165716 RepID=A0A7J0DPF2_9ERIC|nr:hypothetical protein Acr_00g0058820 [Actinidia rufa]
MWFFLDGSKVRNNPYALVRSLLQFVPIRIIFGLKEITHVPQWLTGCTKGNQKIQNIDSGKKEDKIRMEMFGSDDEVTTQIPTNVQTVEKGSGDVLVSEYEPLSDVDYLQELLAIQQQGPRSIGFFGTRNMGFLHQELIEILSYAMKNHIVTSGASGTNAAVIRGALRAEKPELLTVILPQSLNKQPPESQELLAKVQNVIEKPENDHLPLIEASRLVTTLKLRATLVGYVTWTSFLMFNKSFASPSMIADCSWKHVKKPRISER